MALLASFSVSPACAQTAYRINSLQLRDPHTLLNLVSTCQDITNIPGGFNADLQGRMSGDVNGDGILDLSLVIVFPTVDPSAPSGSCQLVNVSCDPASAGSACVAQENITDFTYSNSSSGVCLAPIAGSTHGYSPPIVSPGAPCFATDTHTLAIDLQGVSLTLQDARIGATYSGTLPGTLVNGLLLGFITKADADLTPTSFPGAPSLGALLPGDASSCASYSDLDSDNSVPGWWLYFNFTATPIAFSGNVGVPGNSATATALKLQPLSPNPLSGARATNVRYSTPRDGRVKIAVYDARGRWVTTITDQVQSAGEHSIRWGARDAPGTRVAPGIYFVRVECAGQSGVAKLIVIE